MNLKSKVTCSVSYRSKRRSESIDYRRDISTVTQTQKQSFHLKSFTTNCHNLSKTGFPVDYIFDYLTGLNLFHLSLCVSLFISLPLCLMTPLHEIICCLDYIVLSVLTYFFLLSAPTSVDSLCLLWPLCCEPYFPPSVLCNLATVSVQFILWLPTYLVFYSGIFDTSLIRLSICQFHWMSHIFRLSI